MNVTFTASRLLILIATIIFGVAFGLVLLGNPEPKILWELLFLGSAFFAGGHVLP